MIRIKSIGSAVFAVALFLFAGHGVAQQRPSYGTGINLEMAKKIAAASMVEARRNN